MTSLEEQTVVDTIAGQPMTTDNAAKEATDVGALPRSTPPAEAVNASVSDEIRICAAYELKTTPTTTTATEAPKGSTDPLAAQSSNGHAPNRVRQSASASITSSSAVPARTVKGRPSHSPLLAARAGSQRSNGGGSSRSRPPTARPTLFHNASASTSTNTPMFSTPGTAREVPPPSSQPRRFVDPSRHRSSVDLPRKSPRASLSGDAAEVPASAGTPPTTTSAPEKAPRSRASGSTTAAPRVVSRPLAAGDSVRSRDGVTAHSRIAAVRTAGTATAHNNNNSGSCSFNSRSARTAPSRMPVAPIRPGRASVKAMAASSPRALPRTATATRSRERINGSAARVTSADAENIPATLTPRTRERVKLSSLVLHTAARDGDDTDAGGAPQQFTPTSTDHRQGMPVRRSSQVKVELATTARSRNGSVALSGATTGSTEKYVVSSRPTSTSGQPLHMSNLTRPSEAYKMELHGAQSAGALVRRSRQPRKVLNVYLTKYSVIRTLADEMGFAMQTTEEDLNDYTFNLCWSDTVLSLMRLVRLGNWQRTNHFPSMYLLCRKGHLGTTLAKLRHHLPTHFAFYPRTWSMRSERLQFSQYMTAVHQRRAVRYFIMKPNSGCQGRGIIVTRDPFKAQDEHSLDNYIVQEYVHRPLLLEGKKFDLRVYVLLTSIRHPSIFLFNDGLVRICSEPYEAPTEENVKNACKHLTNYAVNKKSAEYVYNTDVERMDVGNKRNFAFLNRWLTESGYSPSDMWDQVGKIIVKTILAAQPSIARVYDSCFPKGYNDGYCCFEVLGFDVLIDHHMKPWLMEVNHTPSFATDTPLDMEIKSTLLREVWGIIDCRATDHEKDRQREREEFMKRNMPPWTTNHPVYGSRFGQNTARQSAAWSPTGTGGDGAVESPASSAEPAAAATTTQPQASDVPDYVEARRNREDSKLRNFSRIYPSQDPEVQHLYDAVRQLAATETANSRLYYNTTVAAPPLPPSSPNQPGPVRNANVLPLQSWPLSLSPALTSSRVYSTHSSPNVSAPVTRRPSSPVSVTSSPLAAAASDVPATITVSSANTPAGGGVYGGSRDARPVASSTFSRVESSISLPNRAAPVPSLGRLPTPPLAAAASTGVTAMDVEDVSSPAGSAASMERGVGAHLKPAQDTTTASTATTNPPPAVVQMHTPRVSSPVLVVKPVSQAPSSSTTVSPPSAVAKTTAASAPQLTNAAKAATVYAAVTANRPPPRVRPRVAEVHRRTSTKLSSTTALPASASTSAPNGSEEVAQEKEKEKAALSTPKTPTLAQLTPARQLSTAAAETPASLPVHTPITTNIGGTSLHISQLAHSTSVHHTGENTPLAHAVDPLSSPYHEGVMSAPAAVPRGSFSLSVHSLERSMSKTSGAAGATGGAQSAEESRSGSVLLPPEHPMPTEEELARLVALQAQLDYEAAADPQPDDEDDTYNFTE